MNKLVKSLLVAAAFSLTAGATSAYAQEQAQSLEQLLELVKQNRAASQQINKEREAEFTDARADKQALLNRAKKQLADEKARGESLQTQFAENEISLANKEQELQNALGTLGEIVGVARGAASETIGRIATSIVSAQYPGREDVLESVAEAKEVPTIAELEELWLAWLTEMQQSGKVVTFNADVTLLDGSSENRDVTRIGVFNLISNGEYFNYNDSAEEIQPLGRQPEGFVLSAVSAFESATTGYEGLYIDPARGQILNLATQKATLEERYHQGGTVGYVITVALIVGFLIAIYKFVTLGLESAKMRSQLKNTENPSSKNALGRILKVYQENKHADTENLELKLDEAILRETPSIESGVNIIKILAAIAPLLGLLGTVVGMIGTFQSITLFGTGDPKIMAGDISMALVTTALGLIAALPLILVHAIVAARAKSIVHVLDEQAAGIVAAHAEKKE
ncbi:MULTISPECIES: MotA/TolQ/ExbB proton channel family protein [Pseudidiomarina]|uniref:Outer membrane transport energization protein ExbB n=4 Tax=Pseudidiomarina TaxID=2800384 RepID=A0A368V8H3_9GAMM|nr:MULTISPECIES: MotA/TolQ/ExbB proton channel family protein [Pseudidiomarina]MDT7525575.1 MotA/TolQ/ExbB proton channel family protein [Pseudidiomarina sp. GXY010]MDX1524808.1 MotA/TolQ/ExbB proton channel family protein [Pseudidiomarina maritima]PWW15976.1 outer membrane transport energization protein ExbB [Pseudidiomarina maritima]RBP93514.1 outer membrane transport energization protein ExbB [Pseudidiomarina tainanensis]RCW35974.1 outer membrane transport energization protein ExbB [Pseudid